MGIGFVLLVWAFLLGCAGAPVSIVLAVWSWRVQRRSRPSSGFFRPIAAAFLASRPPQAAARDAGSRSGGTPKALGARSRCQWKRLLPLQGQEGPGLWKLSSRPWQSKWHWCRGWIWYSGSI